MAKSIKKPIRFCACLPVLICEQEQTRRVTKSLWDKLPLEQRGQWQSWRTNSYGRKVGVTIYQQIVKIPPYPNPAIDALRAKLKRQRLQWAEELHTYQGREFITITITN